MPSIYRATDAGAYERLMGRWSRRLAAPFLEFAGLKDGETALDVGCGTGSLAAALVRHAGLKRIVGIDFSAAYIDHAKAHHRDPRLEFQVGDACSLALPDASFDRALAHLVLHFVPTPERAIAEMVRVLKPGGRVILIAPAFEFPFGVPPSVGAERASNPVWRLAYSLKRAWWDLTSWLSTEAQFYLIHDPSVLEEGYEEDNDLTQIISIRETRKFFLNQGLKEVYRFSLAEKEENALKKGLKTLLTWLLPQYRYAGVHLFVAFQK